MEVHKGWVRYTKLRDKDAPMFGAPAAQQKEKDGKYNDNDDDQESIRTSNSTNNSLITSITTKARIMDKNAWKLYQEGIKK